MAGILFPQPDMDGDAANFTQWVEGDTVQPYVVEGCNFDQIDASGLNPTATLTGGKARIVKDEFTATQKGKVRRYGNQFVAVMEGHEVTLAADSVNYIFIHPHFEQVGTSVPEYVARTANNPPSAESLLIGTVNTTSSSSERLNRQPRGSYGKMEVTLESILPKYDELSSAPEEPGSIVYITGDGDDESGVHSYNDSTGKWDGPLEGGERTADTQTSVSENGNQLVQNANDINFTDNIVATSDGDGTITVSVSQDGLGYETIDATAAHTASTMEMVLCDASSGSFDITLPDAANNNQVAVVKIDSTSNQIGIVTPNSETINGSDSESVTTQHESVEMISNGSNWFIF